MLAARKLGETAGMTFKPDVTSLPKHVATAGQVLSFKAFFKESVVESGVENYRIRPVVFQYFMEDDTCRVMELKVCVCVCAHACVCVCAHACACVCACMCVFMCANMNMCASCVRRD